MFRAELAGVPAAPGGLRPAAAAKSPGVIYVSDYGNQDVDVYSAASPWPLLTSITVGVGGPVGNCLDAKGTLYVANSAYYTVSTYHNGTLAPGKIFSKGLVAPTSCVVSNGILYIAEFSSNAVVEYKLGGTKPVRTLSIEMPEGVALDAAGNLYVSHNTGLGGYGAVEKYAPASTNGSDLGIAVGFAGDVKIDAAGDILLEDQNSPAIAFFKPGQTQPYGYLKAGYGGLKFALDRSGTLLYAVYFNHNVGIFDAQPNGSSVGSIDAPLSEASGVSVFPAYVP